MKSMDSILLQSKITLPIPRERLISRERLFDSITCGLKGRLTLVCAPAGFGKTTLLSQWTNTRQLPCAWLSLDERDNDIIRFWRYMTYALARSVPPDNAKEMVRLADALPTLSTNSFLDALLNELFALTQDIAVIMDDYHIIQNPGIHDSLSYMIDYLPETTHMIISSRTELPFSTIKWMAKDQRNAIDTLQLQFTAMETQQFYRELSGVELTYRHIEQLVQQTEGWVTALQLVSFSLRAEVNYDRFIEAFQGNHRDVSDYLFHEVMNKLPIDIYQFLVQTSVLGKLEASICNAVTESTNATLMLETVKSLNLFLIPLDDHNGWFRYHHLFSQFLRGLLKKTDPEQWLRSNRMASIALSELGLMDDAIDHAIEAEDYPLMETYLEQHIPAMLQRGEMTTLLNWFHSVPQSFTLSPELSLLYTFILVVTSQLPQAEIQLTRIEQICEGMEQKDRQKQLQSGILFVRSNLVFANGDFGKWFTSTQKIFEHNLPKDPIYYNFNYNPNEPLVRRTALGLKGMLTPDTETIGTLFTGVLDAHGWQDSLINLYVKQSLCEGYYEWNRLEDCLRLLPSLTRAALSKQIPGLHIPVIITQARIHLAEGHYQSAYDRVEEALELALQLSYKAVWVETLQLFRIRIYLQENRISEAKKLITGLGISHKVRPTFNQEYAYLTIARLLGQQRKEPEALRLLEQLKPQSEREQLLSSLVEISCLQALLEAQRGQRNTALMYIHEALAIGERNGYIRSFLDEGTAMRKLLTMYRNHREGQASETKWTGVSEAYPAMLLQLFQESSTPSAERTSLPAEPLNRTEVNLLRLIRQGLTNKQMAAALTLSEGTVKVYLSRLYEKLQVSSRTQAMAASQELELEE